jgi:chromosome segregation ATPase
MSKHETALAMIEDQIEKEEKEQKKVEAEVMTAKAALERKERELKLIDWSLGELRRSRNALQFDRATNNIEPAPSEVP